MSTRTSVSAARASRRKCFVKVSVVSVVDTYSRVRADEAVLVGRYLGGVESRLTRHSQSG